MNTWSNEKKIINSALGQWYSATGNTGNLKGVPLLVRKTTGKAWTDDFYKKRILREAEILKELGSLGTTVVPDFISFTSTDSEAVLCIEHYDHRTVKSLIEKKSLSLEDSVLAAEIIANTLRKFHKKSCIHNYICPWTVSIEKDGEPVFTDLSLAEFGKKCQHERLPEDIPLEEILPFLPPETVRREPSTASSDVFQLGCLLYYCATGTSPWPSNEYVQAVASGSGNPEAPSAINHRVGQELNQLILDMIHLDPRKRPPVKDVEKRLQSCYTVLLNQPDAIQAPLPVTGSHPLQKKLPSKYIGAIVCLLVVIIGGSVSLFLSEDNSRTRPLQGQTPSSTKTPDDLKEGGTNTGTSATENTDSKTNISVAPQSKTPVTPVVSQTNVTSSTTVSPKDYSKVKDVRTLPPEELFSIGYAYHQGEKDKGHEPKTAVYYYGLAAEKGFGKAQNNLAYCLLIGEGTKELFENGKAWLGQAVEQKVPEAVINLAQLYYRGIAGSPEPEKAVEMLRILGDTTNPIALYHLGQSYRMAKSIPRNNEEAVKAFRASAQGGFPPALLKLAQHYEKGIGTKKNTIQADLCRKQAEQLEKNSPVDFNTKLLLATP